MLSSVCPPHARRRRRGAAVRRSAGRHAAPGIARAICARRIGQLAGPGVAFQRPDKLPQSGRSADPPSPPAPTASPTASEVLDEEPRQPCRGLDASGRFARRQIVSASSSSPAAVASRLIVHADALTGDQRYAPRHRVGVAPGQLLAVRPRQHLLPQHPRDHRRAEPVAPQLGRAPRPPLARRTRPPPAATGRPDRRGGRRSSRSGLRRPPRGRRPAPRP